MSTNNIGIEFNGGENNQVIRTKVIVNGEGKGIVTHNSSKNTFEDVQVIINAQQNLAELKEVLNLLNDTTINEDTGKTFKEDALEQIKKLLEEKHKPGNIERLTALTNLLSSWITLKSALSPILSPFIDMLKGTFGG
ncbi:hypothetical protein KSB09_21180 [Acinetobacter baumannii]|nr:hypothetical protein [Acinetobacter baumannii]